MIIPTVSLDNRKDREPETILDIIEDWIWTKDFGQKEAELNAKKRKTRRQMSNFLRKK